MPESRGTSARGSCKRRITGSFSGWTECFMKGLRKFIPRISTIYKMWKKDLYQQVFFCITDYPFLKSHFTNFMLGYHILCKISSIYNKIFPVLHAGGDDSVRAAENIRLIKQCTSGNHLGRKYGYHNLIFRYMKRCACPECKKRPESADFDLLQ